MAVAVMLVVHLASSRAGAVDARFWTLTPYSIRVLVAVDARSVPSADLADLVAERIVERADASVGALWKLSVDPQRGADALRLLNGFGDAPLRALAEAKDPPDPQPPEGDDEANAATTAAGKPVDKLIVVTLRETPAGVVVAAVEHDRLLRQTGRTHSAPPCEMHEAPEAAFASVCAVFSPVALFEVDRKSGLDARLTFRGSQLPSRPGVSDWAAPGAILMPVMRQIDRQGDVVEGGVKPAPWTYFLLSGDVDQDGAKRAKIYSHTKRPFGARRRGRVEQYALMLQPGDGPTRIHLHARGRPEQPLPGYQAYLQDGDEADRVAIGVSNADGRLAIEHGDAPIPYVYIKSGSQVVAKAPVPVGSLEEITIPLLDERARIEAEAKLGLLREELIDLVARRSILASRIRDQIKKGKKDEARRLLQTLDNLPGRAQFSQKLSRVQQQSTSDDPKVQQRIDRLFSDTAAVLGAFLGAGQVEELRREIESGPNS